MFLFLSFIIIFVSILLLYNQKLTQFILKMNNSPSIQQTNTHEIKSNQKESKKDDFDFSKASRADITTALKATFKDDKVPVLGGISIPDLKINLPILRGVSDYAILMGAGTMKKNQQMGEGNYSLTSHHMLNKEVLFGPIIYSEKDMPIYLTDLDYVYEYRVEEMRYIAATDVHEIEDQDNKKELTLITCDETGEGRFLVRASFIRKTAVENARSEIMDSFYAKQNLYE